MTCDGKWVSYENPKRQKAWVLSGEPGLSTPKCNIHAQKVMLGIWWDQEGMVYHELRKLGKTKNTQQLMKLNQALKNKRPEFAKRHDKPILLHDN